MGFNVQSRVCAVGALTIAACFLNAFSASAQSVELEVTGSIEASCALSGVTSSVTGLNFTSANSVTLDYTVDCNAPFAYAIESANQAFTRTSGDAVVGGSSSFADTLPYNVTTSFTTDNGSFGDVSLSSSDLTAANTAPCVGASFDIACEATFSNSGTDVAANPTGTNASLQVAWGNSATPLLAGTYQDTLTLTVRVK